MKNRTIRPYLIRAGLLAGLVVLLAGCPDLFIFDEMLEPVQRVDAFVESISADPQDIATIRTHFHPSSTTYQTIDASFWSLTPFGPDDKPFTFSDLTEGTTDPDYPGSATVSGTFTSANVTDGAITFVLLEDPNLPNNWLIREIDTGLPGDVLQQVR